MRQTWEEHAANHDAFLAYLERHPEAGTERRRFATALRRILRWFR